MAIKSFTTIACALNFIKRNAETGMELTINESIHFGVKRMPYIYSSDVENLNIAGLITSGTAFTDLTTDEQIERAISFYLQKDGHLIIQ